MRTAPVAGLSIASGAKEVVAVSSIEIRAFERRDREQLTELVNAHVDGEGLAIRRVVGHNGMTGTERGWSRPT